MNNLNMYTSLIFNLDVIVNTNGINSIDLVHTNLEASNNNENNPKICQNFWHNLVNSYASRYGNGGQPPVPEDQMINDENGNRVPIYPFFEVKMQQSSYGNSYSTQDPVERANNVSNALIKLTEQLYPSVPDPEDNYKNYIPKVWLNIEPHYINK